MTLLLKDIPFFVKTHIIPLLKTHNVLTFTGPLGAGKTTIIREILQQAGVHSSITSPTFGYVKSYTGSHNQQFHHFDLYRIESVEAFIAAGFDEYLSQKNSFSFIEWPAVIAPLLETPNMQQKVVHIFIEPHENNAEARNIKIITYKLLF